MAENDNQIKDIVNFIQLNSPEDLNERLKLNKRLNNKKTGIFFPSILGDIANELDGKLTISFSFNNKNYTVNATGVNSENLAVEYSNRMFAEVLESGVVKNFTVTDEDGSIYAFENKENFYQPLETETTNNIYHHILAPFYKKIVLDDNIF